MFIVKMSRKTLDTKVKYDRFLIKARKIHGDKYNYCVEYVDCKTPLKITCKYHGDFYQTPDSHIQGQGCGKCAVRSNWSKEGYVNFVNSNYGGFSTLYLIECHGNGERFLKIGNTCRTVEKRFIESVMPYKYDVIYSNLFIAELTYDLEKSILKNFKGYRYEPKIEFGGKTECISLDKKEHILKSIEEFLYNENAK